MPESYLNLFKHIQKYKDKWSKWDEDFENVEFVNVGYDKSLVPVLKYDKWLGDEAITDRRKLCHFLDKIKDVDYKYLIIDVMLTESYEKELDDSLFFRINNMKRVVVARDKEGGICSGLESKSASAVLKSHLGDNFTRFEYSDKIASIPLYVYNDIRRDNGMDLVTPHKCFESMTESRLKNALNFFSIYTQGTSLCQNSIFLAFDSYQYDGNFRKDIGGYGEEKQYARSLGRDILGKVDFDFNKEFGGKYIVIGDLVNDVHDTYMGSKPGSVILMKALKLLDDQKHLVNAWFVALLIVIYYFISMAWLTDFYFFKKYLWNHLSATARFLLSFVSYGCILWIISFIDYAVWGTSYSFVIPMCFLSVIKVIQQIKHKFYEN